MIKIIDYVLFFYCKNSLSPTPQASLTPLVEPSESLTCDENVSSKKSQLLCNNSYSRSPSPTATTLTDEVKKLAIHTSDPDINSKFKTNSPLASSSNLTSTASKPDADQHLRLMSHNNNNNNNSSENNGRKWHCLVSQKYFYDRVKKCVHAYDSTPN